VGNEEVLKRIKKERNVLNTIKRRKANRIGHIWRINYFVTQVIERRSDWKTRKKT
jgi:hypothetical protein